MKLFRFLSLLLWFSQTFLLQITLFSFLSYFSLCFFPQTTNVTSGADWCRTISLGAVWWKVLVVMDFPVAG